MNCVLKHPILNTTYEPSSSFFDWNIDVKSDVERVGHVFDGDFTPDYGRQQDLASSALARLEHSLPFALAIGH
jgi:hypothetical protein